ncbi:hypothetical protein TNCV_3083921 [Trichonephila clavipes]|nr:hypothetical protein TNCV_3083921 [Trichonephila clavipes]
MDMVENAPVVKGLMHDKYLSRFKMLALARFDNLKSGVRTQMLTLSIAIGTKSRDVSTVDLASTDLEERRLVFFNKSSDSTRK